MVVPVAMTMMTMMPMMVMKRLLRTIATTKKLVLALDQVMSPELVVILCPRLCGTSPQ